jgi:hypothetical protein
MAIDGLVTVFNWGDAKSALDDWLAANPGRFETVDGFRCWTGNRIHEQQVLAGQRVENYRWITLRRVGQTVTPGSYSFPDEMFDSEDNFDPTKVTCDGRRMWPVQSLGEDEDSPEDWWKTKKLDTPLRAGTFVRWFKYHLVEDFVTKGSFTRIPFEAGSWLTDPIMTWQQRELLANAFDNAGDLPAVRHTISGEKHRTKLVWFYYWWLQRHTAPGDSVFIPFAGDGDAILASLIAGRGFYGVENNTHRAKVCADLLLEYRKRFPYGG